MLNLMVRTVTVSKRSYRADPRLFPLLPDELVIHDSIIKRLYKYYEIKM
jgi:hypothetical protein